MKAKQWNQQTDSQCAAVVCAEVALQNALILYAERSEPVEEADSGWQFGCGRPEEEWQTARVWSVREVLLYDPSIEPFISLPPGTVLARSSSAMKWTVRGVNH